MENRGKLTVLVGGQYGSEGKGSIAAHISYKYDVHVRVGSPNAGHTIWWNNEKHVMQTIPCGWINPDAKIFIGRGALVNIRLLLQEIEHIEKYYPDFRKRLFIDSEAGVLDEHFHEEEGGINGEMHHRIGSTGEGVGLARIARIERDPNKFNLIRDVAEKYGIQDLVYENTPLYLSTLQLNKRNILIEGTQGSALSLYHSYWPYCTSVDTNASGIIAEVGIAPSCVTDVIMVCRTYPIRVAGNSGPMKNEITWEELSERVGYDVIPEKTTVTRKIRRIAEWDDELYLNSCLLNAPTEIALTFCDYVDPQLYGVSHLHEIHHSKLLREFMYKHGLGATVKYFGTGPKTVVEVM